MAIKVVCRCGKSFQVTDDSAGRKARCPQCGDTLVIPNERVIDHLEVVETDNLEVVEETPTTQQTGIEVNASFFPLGWTLYFTKPTVEIDDRERTISWWRTEFFPLKPGKHKVRCFVNWIGFGTGMKKIDVRVRPNRVLSVRYQHMLWWAELTADD